MATVLTASGALVRLLLPEDSRWLLGTLLGLYKHRGLLLMFYFCKFCILQQAALKLQS